MLYRVEIENFLSVRDRQILDLTVSPGVIEDEERFAPLFPGSKDRAPKVVAFYGANASGKTTILKALDFITQFVRQNGELPQLRHVMAPFADKVCAERPISFAIEFGGVVDFTADADTPKPSFGLLRYELEFEVVNGLPMRVSKEALRQKPGGKGRWARIFERDIHGEVTGSDSFRLAQFRHLQNTLNPMVSVLASYAYFQHPAAMFYMRETSLRSQSNLPAAGAADGTSELFAYLYREPHILQAVNNSLGRVDTGVEEMRVEQFSDGFRAVFKHSGLDLDLVWDSESQGTKAFVRLFPSLHIALNIGAPALIDEFDTLLHPLILPEILRWFYEADQDDHSDAQLFLTCHSATLLEDLVKEEVVIVKKDRHGATSLFSLMDVKSTRRDENLYKKYLGGAYGGVPVIG